MSKRRRGSLHRPNERLAPLAARRPPVDRGPARGFEALVQRALDGIPEPFASALREVAVVIEDEPTRHDLIESGLDPDEETLYGLYEGVPRTEWAADSVPLPNRITLYRVPLAEDFPNPDDLAEEVRITVIHELAHHLGIEEDRLHELGVD